MQDKAKNPSEEIDQLYRDVFDTPKGQKVLDHLAMEFWLINNAFDEHNERKTTFRLGERNVVAYIIDRTHGSVERKRIQEHFYNAQFEARRRRGQ